MACHDSKRQCIAILGVIQTGRSIGTANKLWMSCFIQTVKLAHNAFCMSFGCTHSFWQLVYVRALALCIRRLPASFPSQHIQSNLEPVASWHGLGHVSRHACVCQHLTLACIESILVVRKVLPLLPVCMPVRLTGTAVKANGPT